MECLVRRLVEVKNWKLIAWNERNKWTWTQKKRETKNEMKWNETQTFDAILVTLEPTSSNKAPSLTFFTSTKKS